MAQVTERPMIWVKDSEKQAILNEISTNSWKTLYYNSFKIRVDKDRASYLADRQTYLKLLPFNNTNAVVGVIPPLKTITDSQTTASADRARIKKHLQSGVDSGVMYYLTGDVEYAKYSASIFYHYQPTKLKNRQIISFNPCKNKGCFINQKTYLPLILE